eukprot:CAMPEP_0171179972 /NCGR_PEP_ID=MMETSP0790-20130122/13523_1 /TAXON_ID=2925 /ORGANISM="Alexandrium catenella, Strain OF101" /LENGTH=203 /DNA_ID=CAMNT_0011644903 /DNA_START=163 /DNA_END=774 /DNA_ORIENTATION=+
MARTSVPRMSKDGDSSACSHPLCRGGCIAHIGPRPWGNVNSGCLDLGNGASTGLREWCRRHPPHMPEGGRPQAATAAARPRPLLHVHQQAPKRPRPLCSACGGEDSREVIASKRGDASGIAWATCSESRCPVPGVPGLRKVHVGISGSAPSSCSSSAAHAASMRATSPAGASAAASEAAGTRAGAGASAPARAATAFSAVPGF